MAPASKSKSLRVAGKVVLLTAIALFAIPIAKVWRSTQKMDQKPQLITIYHPYKPIFPMDPRKIYSVGDQVLSEHIFAFHSRESIKSGFQPVVSNVTFDNKSHTVKIEPRFPLKNSDGSLIPLKTVCDAAISSFKGTQHSPFSSIFISADCSSDHVTLNLSKIPVNLRFLFTLPDFSIFEPNLLPLTGKSPIRSTGPYSFDGIDGNGVKLKRNSFYPSSLVANQVENVLLKSYSSAETAKLVDEVDPNRDQLLYLYGHALSEEGADRLRHKGYRLNYFPSEWMVYINFTEKLPTTDRNFIGNIIDSNRDPLMHFAKTGQKAFSIAPSDRSFGVNEKLYFEQNLPLNSASNYKPKSFIFGTLSHWYKIPLFKATLDLLIQSTPGSTLKLFDDFDKMQTEADVSLQMLGISPADPLSHLTFLMKENKSYSSVLTDQIITKLSLIDDAETFNRSVRDVELDIASKRIIIPIAHFPGIVAEAPGFERDEALAWSWGTQAWTYRIR